MLVPGACRWSTGRTAPRTAWEIGAKNAPLPRPIRISGATRLPYGTSGAAMAASQPRPAAHGRGRPALPGEEGGHRERAGTEREQDLWAAPALALSAYQAPDQREQSGAGERDAGHVEPVVGPAALVDAQADERDERQSHGHVEPEDAGHENASISAPPSTGPSTTASPATAPHAPSATQRRWVGTAAVRIVGLSGTRTAPPAPCTARAAPCAPIEGASAAASDPAVTTPRRHEHSTTSEAIPERRAGEQQHGSTERVGVGHPLQRLGSRPGPFGSPAARS